MCRHFTSPRFPILPLDHPSQVEHPRRSAQPAYSGSASLCTTEVEVPVTASYCKLMRHNRIWHPPPAFNEGGWHGIVAAEEEECCPSPSMCICRDPGLIQVHIRPSHRRRYARDLVSIAASCHRAVPEAGVHSSRRGVPGSVIDLVSQKERAADAPGAPDKVRGVAEAVPVPLSAGVVLAHTHIRRGV